MIVMSMMCMAPDFGLRAQDSGQKSSEVKLKPQKDDSGKWGFVDEQGKKVIPFEYEAADEFSEGLAAVQIKKKYGFVDAKGNIVIPAMYDV